MFESENPIAIRSKKWMADALMALMEEKPFRKITIQELAERAQLDRRTFYRHFSSKEDVLNSYIKMLGDEYVAALLKNESISIPLCLQVFFEIADKHRAFLVQLRHNDLLMFVLNVFNQLLPSVHNLIKERFNGILSITHGDDIGYIFAFNMGGFWNILIKWIDENFSKTPVQLAEIVSKLMV